jgi:putative acetyltransferase
METSCERSDVAIRSEAPADYAAVREINLRAFGQANEADLVDALRSNCRDHVSLVAEADGQPVGHILFTPVVIESPENKVTGMGLAPMAVLPVFQRRGIGSRLIEAGLDRLRHDGQPFVVVLGHPEYYPRFGFRPASQFGVACEFEGVPDEAFMMIALEGPWPKDVAGIAHYQPEFRRFS